MTSTTPQQLAPTQLAPTAGALAPAAERAAHALLALALPRRWAHVQRVAATAAELLESLPLDDAGADLAVAAAWVHDIGYSPALTVTGFHPLDRAVWLTAHGWPPALVGLVAHHSLADLEAGHRGHTTALAGHLDSPGLVRDVLWVADATSGPDGRPVTIDERLADVVDRYGPEDLVSRCMCAVADAARSAEIRLRAALNSRSPTRDRLQTEQAAVLSTATTRIV